MLIYFSPSYPQGIFIGAVTMGILGVLASVALLVGGVQTTMVLSENDRLAAEESKSPVVEVQAIQTDASKSAPIEL
jgi:hypothetical protein